MVVDRVIRKEVRFKGRGIVVDPGERFDELLERFTSGSRAVRDAKARIRHILAVRGSGDGGIYSTGADISSLWSAMFAGRIVSMERIAEMVHPHSNVPEKSARYGWGSGSMSRAMWWSCTDTTPASPSEAFTIPSNDSPTR